MISLHHNITLYSWGTCSGLTSIWNIGNITGRTVMFCEHYLYALDQGNFQVYVMILI